MNIIIITLSETLANGIKYHVLKNMTKYGLFPFAKNSFILGNPLLHHIYKAMEEIHMITSIAI